MSERVRVVARSDGSLIARKPVADPASLDHERAMLAAALHPGVVIVAESETAASVTGWLDTHWAGTHSLETHPTMSARHVAGVMAALATTVADLHQSGLTHGRIEGSHVLIGREGRPLLCGFAAAHRTPTIAHHDHHVRCADDVHTLGTLLHRLLSDAPTRRDGTQPRRWSDRSRGERRGLLRGGHACDARRSLPSAIGPRLAAAIIAAVPTADLPPAPPDPTPSDEPLARCDDTHDTVEGAEGSREEPPPVRSGPLADLEALDRLRATADEPPPPRRVLTPTRIASALAVLVLAALAIAVALPQPHQVSAPRADASTPRSTRPAPTPTPTGEPVLVASDQPSGSASSPGACASTQLATANIAADIDGDHCPDAVRIDGNIVVVGDRQWQLGEPGDAITLADWDCDGTATPALLRRPTGEIFVFDAWAAPGDRVSVDTLSTVADAALIGPTPGEACPDLIVTRRDGETVSLPAS